MPLHTAPPITSLRIVAWNLNHRAQVRGIPPWIAAALAAQEPDVVVLTEYVQGPDHARFVHELAAAGLTSMLCSTPVSGQNQVLIASREHLEPGWIVAPALAPSLPSNLLHARLESGLHVVGFRMPAHKKAVTKRASWDWLQQALRSFDAPHGHAPAVLVGDFNTAIGDPRSTGGDIFERLEREGWNHAQPAEGHSYRDAHSGSERRIDHLLHNKPTDVGEARYDWSFTEQCEDAARKTTGLPDHAMLVAWISCASVGSSFRR